MTRQLLRGIDSTQPIPLRPIQQNEPTNTPNQDNQPTPSDDTQVYELPACVDFHRYWSCRLSLSLAHGFSSNSRATYATKNEQNTQQQQQQEQEIDRHMAQAAITMPSLDDGGMQEIDLDDKEQNHEYHHAALTIEPFSSMRHAHAVHIASAAAASSPVTPFDPTSLPAYMVGGRPGRLTLTYTSNRLFAEEKTERLIIRVECPEFVAIGRNGEEQLLPSIFVTLSSYKRHVLSTQKAQVNHRVNHLRLWLEAAKMPSALFFDILERIAKAPAMCLSKQAERHIDAFRDTYLYTYEGGNFPNGAIAPDQKEKRRQKKKEKQEKSSDGDSSSSDSSASDDEDRSSKKRRRRKSGASRFIDDMAAEGSEDDSEDDEDMASHSEEDEDDEDEDDEDADEDDLAFVVDDGHVSMESDSAASEIESKPRKSRRTNRRADSPTPAPAKKRLVRPKSEDQDAAMSDVDAPSPSPSPTDSTASTNSQQRKRRRIVSDDEEEEEEEETEAADAGVGADQDGLDGTDDSDSHSTPDPAVPSIVEVTESKSPALAPAKSPKMAATKSPVLTPTPHAPVNAKQQFQKSMAKKEPHTQPPSSPTFTPTPSPAATIAGAADKNKNRSVSGKPHPLESSSAQSSTPPSPAKASQPAKKKQKQSPTAALPSPTLTTEPTPTNPIPTPPVSDLQTDLPLMTDADHNERKRLKMLRRKQQQAAAAAAATPASASTAMTNIHSPPSQHAPTKIAAIKESTMNALFDLASDMPQPTSTPAPAPAPAAAHTPAAKPNVNAKSNSNVHGKSPLLKPATAGVLSIFASQTNTENGTGKKKKKHQAKK